MAAQSGKTKLITVASNAASAVVALTETPSITISEDPSVANYPTTDFKIMKPTSSDDARRIQAGLSYTFVKNGSARYLAGEIAGYIQAVTAPTTMCQDEHG